MDAFNFTFTLFGLLLGLSLAQVLKGFARALQRRRVVHLGWLTPLLAIFVMLDLTSFWEWVWSGRRLINPGYGILVIGLFVCGLYYLAASIVFPAEFGEGRRKLHGADFDEHYMEQRRQVLGAILLCNLITVVPVLAVRASDVPARAWIEAVVYFAALLIAMATSSKKVGLGALTVLIVGYVFTAIASFIQPVPL